MRTDCYSAGRCGESEVGVSEAKNNSPYTIVYIPCNNLICFSVLLLRNSTLLSPRCELIVLLEIPVGELLDPIIHVPHPISIPQVGDDVIPSMKLICTHSGALIETNTSRAVS